MTIKVTKTHYLATKDLIVLSKLLNFQFRYYLATWTSFNRVPFATWVDLALMWCLTLRGFRFITLYLLSFCTLSSLFLSYNHILLKALPTTFLSSPILSLKKVSDDILFWVKVFDPTIFGLFFHLLETERQTNSENQFLGKIKCNGDRCFTFA